MLLSSLGFIKIILGAALWHYMKGVISLESMFPGWCDKKFEHELWSGDEGGNCVGFREETRKDRDVKSMA